VLISVAEAAILLRLKSRGSVYRKIKTGELATKPGPDGKSLIERDRLEERWAAITRTETDSPAPLRAASERTKPKPAQEEAPPPPQRPTPAEPKDPEDLPEYNVSRARAEYEKANLLELQRKTQEGQLLRREDAEAAWSQAVNITKSRLRGVPSAVKQRVPHLEPEEVDLMVQLIDEALNELSAGEATK
jgi:hypothetical protein